MGVKISYCGLNGILERFAMNLDQTYCASPNCTNGCGRKLTDDMKSSFNGLYPARLIAYAYFCDQPPQSQISNTFQIDEPAITGA